MVFCFAHHGVAHGKLYYKLTLRVMFYVYVLQSSKDGKFYIGYTHNLRNRLIEHKGGKVQSTKNRLPLKLIYCEAYLAKSDAEGREKFLKSGSGHRYLNKQLKNYLSQFSTNRTST